jgi:hypothetical protein
MTEPYSIALGDLLYSTSIANNYLGYTSRSWDPAHREQVFREGHHDLGFEVSGSYFPSSVGNAVTPAWEHRVLSLSGTFVFRDRIWPPSWNHMLRDRLRDSSKTFQY